MKYVNTGVVFQEIPDEVTLAVNISNCPCRCKGCHSRYLWDDVGTPLTVEAIDGFMRKYGNDITCLCFMGGDADPCGVVSLARYVRIAYPSVKLGWYSGRSSIGKNVDSSVFDYIKLGPYIESLGGLDSPSTNPRLYRREADGSLVDMTGLFCKTFTPNV